MLDTAQNKFRNIQSEHHREEMMIGFPVIFLPVTNILLAVIVKMPLTPVITYIIGAVAEEMFFRFFLLKSILLPRLQARTAVLLSAALFAGMHLLNLFGGVEIAVVLVQILCAFCFGVWAGAVVWKKNSIVIPLLAHILLNMTAVAEDMVIPMIAGIPVLLDGILLMKDCE